MSGLQIVGGVVAEASRGSSGIGPVVIAAGLTIASVLVLSWVINRLPGSNENTGASPFRRRGREDPFRRPPDDSMG
jgi:hypothetical protein